MEPLFIIPISALAVCIVLGILICCVINSRFCHCIDYAWVNEDAEPVKTREYSSRTEYYAPPVVKTSSYSSEFASNGYKYPYPSYASKQLESEASKTNLYPASDSSETSYLTKTYQPESPRQYGRNPSYSESPKFQTQSVQRTYYSEEPKETTTYYSEKPRETRTEVSGTAYQPSRGVYQFEREAGSFSQPERYETSSYSWSTSRPYQVPTSSDVGYRAVPQREPYYQPPLKKSGSQSSLYENN